MTDTIQEWPDDWPVAAIEKIEEAADEIDRLERECERLREALKVIDGVMCNFPTWFYEEGLDVIARRALGEVEGE